MASGKILQAIVEIAGSLSPTLGEATQQAQKSLEGVNLKAIAVGAVLGGMAITVGKATISASAHLAEFGDEYNKAMNDLSAQTGKTGEDLENLGDVVKNVYGNNFGESLNEAANAVAQVQKLTDLSGEALQNATESAFALSDTFGYEISESTRTASALTKNMGIDAQEAYNLIAYGAQNGADQNGDLLDTLNEYAGQYAALGLSADQFVAGLTTASDAGVFSIDKVGDAVKEFNIRSKDMSDTSAQAYETLGMNADEMFSKFASGGDSANEAFFEVVNALQNMDDPLEKNTAAVNLFGTMYEDLGDDILPILASMEDATLENIDALGQINDVKYNDIGTAIEAVKRKAEVSFLPLATTIANSLMNIMPVVVNIMDGLSPIIEDATASIIPIVQNMTTTIVPIIQEFAPVIFDTAQAIAEQLIPPLLEMIQQVLPVVIELVSSVLPLLSQVISAILPVMVQLITAILPPIMQIISAVLPVVIELLNVVLPILMTLLDTLMPILNTIMGLIEPIVSLISTAITPLISVLGSLISQILEILAPTLQLIAGIFTSVLGTAIQGIAPVVQSITQIFQGLIDFITNVFSGNWSAAWDGIVSIFSGIVSGIAAIFKAPINTIIKGINAFLNGLNKIKIPDWVPVVGGMGFNIPNIPMLAKGGFTEGITIAGEAGTEAVISFDHNVRAANIGYWEKAGEMLGVYNDSETALAGKLLNVDDFSLAELAQPSTTVIYDFSGFTWSPVIEGGKATGDNDDLIRRLKAHEAEFFDWLDRWLRAREVTAFA